MYYAEESWGASVIYRVNMDGTGKEVVRSTGINIIEVLIADYNRDKLFFTDWGRLVRCNLDGSDPHVFFAGMIADAKMDFSRNQLYVLAHKLTTSEVFSVVYKIDESDTILTASDLDPVLTLPHCITSFAPDFSNDCIYFQSYLGTTTQETVITKTNMDGSNPETILVISQPPPPSRNLELSYSQQRLYWCSGGDICMLDLEVGASSFQSVYVTQGNVNDLVVDNFHNRLYWTGNKPASIQKSDLSVQNIETVLTEPDIIGGEPYTSRGPQKLDVVLKQPFSSVPTMGQYGLFIFASLFILLALALKKRN